MKLQKNKTIFQIHVVDNGFIVSYPGKVVEEATTGFFKQERKEFIFDSWPKAAGFIACLLEKEEKEQVTQ